jgi:hypothetical protein
MASPSLIAAGAFPERRWNGQSAMCNLAVEQNPPGNYLKGRKITVGVYDRLRIADAS